MKKGTREKIRKLSPALQKKIVFDEIFYETGRGQTPVSDELVRTKLHCNAGRTVEAGLQLRKHCDGGGKIFLTMAGAGSSFQMGITISQMIRAGKIAAISVTGANLEESLYRLVANDEYAHIPRYEELTPSEEKALDHAGLRRITDTFLPEEESVRKILPIFEKLWRKAQKEKRRYLWHEFFFQFFQHNDAPKLGIQGRVENCWLYQAWLYKIPIFVPGWEDSTLGNVFAAECLEKRFGPSLIKSGIEYMMALAAWYQTTSKAHDLGFFQIGGGIAGDFPICVVPLLEQDAKQRDVKKWQYFCQVTDAEESYGGYSGALPTEKRSWGKLPADCPAFNIKSDASIVVPLIFARVLGW